MRILSSRRLQSKNPIQFLYLIIDRVEFNPKAYLGKEQDYLELNLKVQSGLLDNFSLQRLEGGLSIDGSQPEERFEILDELVIQRTGQATTWSNIIVRLSSEIQGHLHLKREQGQDVVVSVHLRGYRDYKVVLELHESTKGLRVPKLPSS